MPTSPDVHVLVPVHNSQAYIEHALRSALLQSYQPLKVIVYNDGSRDNTAEIIRSIPAVGKMHVIDAAENRGVAFARNRLLEASEALNPDACFMWLDSDDHFAEDHCVDAVLTQLRRAKADICLFDFNIHWEELSAETRVAASVVLAEKVNHGKLLAKIESAPGKTVSIHTCPNLLTAISAGWVMACAASVRKNWPSPVEGALYEDNPPMAALLNADRVTVVNQPVVNYLRRSGSVTDKAIPRHFLVDRPVQLRRFMEYVDPSSPAKARAAAGFVEAKLKRAADMLDQLVAARHPGFDEGVRAEFEGLRSKLIEDSRRLADDSSRRSPRSARV